MRDWGGRVEFGGYCAEATVGRKEQFFTSFVAIFETRF
jgi:hypothetical protein